MNEAASGEDLKAKVLEVHAALCREYGCPIAYFHQLDPLSELVSSLPQAVSAIDRPIRGTRTKLCFRFTRTAS